ncbi:MAG TPA: sugar transferase [Bryobacteraceae bacterium]|nr:sugar transferase [Bryobacteraceae bacterium]
MSSINFNAAPVETTVLQETAVPRRFAIPETLECAAGLVLLALASPVIAASALAVAALSRRSPFVAHLRVGRDGEPFWVRKLRTMWSQDKLRQGRPGWVEYIIAEPLEDRKDESDPRVASRFAAFCRRHSIDELPQLWHVARGEMSLVGPRPLTRSEVSRYYGRQAAELLSVKPGITGLWQVCGRSAIRFPRRSAMDLQLVRALTPAMYLKILLRTFPAVIFGKNAW